MKYKWFVALVCLAVGCTGQSDEAMLCGSWQLEEMSGTFTFGLPPFRIDDRELLSFESDTFVFSNNPASETVIKGTFSCDDKKTPKQIVFSYNGQTVAAIYKVSRGSLYLCVGADDKSPPTTFIGGPESRPASLRFTRVD